MTIFKYIPFIKSLIRFLIINPFNQIVLIIRIAYIKYVFKNAKKEPVWLGEKKLQLICNNYIKTETINANYYNAKNNEERGIKRAKEIITLQKLLNTNFNDVLELGCWDGMVSAALQKKGMTTTAIDHNSEGFEIGAIKAGVKLIQMDAHELSFDNDTFDFIFSYDTFEHFKNPENVLNEASRVLKKGGHLYFSFGPLYNAPHGLHYYNILPIPYCQHLFSKPLLDSYILKNNLSPIDYGQLNFWGLDDFKNLFHKFTKQLEIISFKSYKYYDDIDLILKYPSCFKSKTNSFDNLTTSAITVLLKKTN